MTTKPGCSGTIQINFSNSREISEDQDGYVVTDHYHSHSREVANYLEVIVPSTNDESSVICSDVINSANINPNPF